MDSQYSTAAISELMSAVRQVQKKTQRNTGNPVFVTIHFVLAGLAVVAFAAVVLCRLVGYQIGDELTDKYVFSLVTSVLFFAVGTLMIERLSGDVFGGFLGRALALCGLFVMSTQCYEFMQKTRACEVQHELLAKQKATGVSQFVSMTDYEFQTERSNVKWSTEDGRRRPMSVVYRRPGFSGSATGRHFGSDSVQYGAVGSVPHGASNQSATDGSESF